jgi:ribulose-phosphate 3-epimerase
MKDIKISILNLPPASRASLQDSISSMEQAFSVATVQLHKSGYFVRFGWHIDVMDGKYVPQLACSPQELEAILSVVTWPTEVHYMIEPNVQYSKVCDDKAVIQHHIGNDFNTGDCLAINPDEDVTKAMCEQYDKFLVMTVVPGLGGQKFIDKATWKVDAIKKYNKSALIEYDGGVNLDTLGQCEKADAVVIGSEAMRYFAQGEQAFKDYLIEATKTWL